jgi:hypothetical protein
MARPGLEVADIFRDYGSAWRRAHAGHVSLGQLKVMSAIERCRTAALGGHIEACEDCGQVRIAYNSCRNRHCPKCQGAAARDWLADREATIAADPKHLGARIGLTAVLHTWGSAMTHHPHVHMIVPGGGLSPDGTRWIPCRPNFFLPVRILSKLFRRLILDKLATAHAAGHLRFFGAHADLTGPKAFAAFLARLRNIRWFVYAKRPFAGPEAVLAYLARYTHRVAISNSRLICADDSGVTFTWKDYRVEGRERCKTMALAIDEFIRRFLLHVLPRGFHRIRHYGLFANGSRATNLTRARALLGACEPRCETATADPADATAPSSLTQPCPYCGGRMISIERFARGSSPANRSSAPNAVIRVDTS